MKERITKIKPLLMIVLLIFSFSATVSGTIDIDQTNESDITGLLQSTIDGYVDLNAPENYVAEWGDANTKTIALSGSNSEAEAKLFSKVVSNQLMVAMTTSAQLTGFELQVDLDASGDLSTNDIILSQYQTQELGKWFTDVLLFDAETESWKPLYQLLGYKEPNLEASMLASSIAEVSIKTQPDGATNTGDKGMTGVEVKFNPTILELYLAEYKDNYVSSFAGSDDIKNVNFAIHVESNEGSFNYPASSSVVDNKPKYDEYDVNNFKTTIDSSWFVDYGVSNIELTQAVQYANESLRLVKGKQTLARVFVDNPTSSPVDVNVELKGYYRSGGSLHYLGTLSQKFEAPTTPNRQILSDTANFELPDTWEDQYNLLLKAKVSPQFLLDGDWSNNEISQQYYFTDTHELNIYYIRVNEGTQSSPSQPTTSQVATMQDAVEATFPAEINWVEMDWETIGVFSGDDHDLIGEVNDVLGGLVLAMVIAEILGTGSSLVIPDQIVAFRSGSGGHSDPTWNNHGAKMAYTTTAGVSSGAMTAAHEINHNLGPNSWGRHVSGSTSTGSYGCSAPGSDATWQTTYNDGAIHALGWNPASGLISPSTTDFMTYCSNNWISDYRWENLIDKLRTTSYTPGDPTSFQLDDLDEGYQTMLDKINVDQVDEGTTSRLISGTVDTKGGITMNPSFEIPGPSSFDLPQNNSNQSPSNYIEINFVNGTSRSFPVYDDITAGSELSDAHENGDLSRTSFRFWFPDRKSANDGSGIDYYRILDASGNVKTGGSPSGYTVSGDFLAPSSISRDQTTLIDWSDISHTIKSPYFQLQYSHDNETWQNVGDPTSNQYKYTTFNNFPGGEAYFRVLISDGFRTEIKYSTSASTISDLSPKAKILRNSNVNTDLDLLSLDDSQLSSNYINPDVENVVLGSEISFRASGLDPEEGDLGSSAFEWTIYDSDKNPIMVMPGDNVQFSLFKPGTYTAEVSVTDSTGNSGTDVIQFKVTSPSYTPTKTVDAFKEGLTLDDSDGTETTTEKTTETVNANDSETANPALPVSSASIMVSFGIIVIAMYRKRRMS